MEVWDLYTKDRLKTGQTIERGKDLPQGYYRIVVHVCIFNSRGEMLIQQRQPFKKGWSNMWDLTTGGSAIAGDSSQSAAQRELFEELGINLDFSDMQPALTINCKNIFDDIYLIEKDIDISTLKLQYEEVQTVKWADINEIKSLIEKDLFIPYHKSLIDLLFYMRNHDGTHTRQDK